MECTYKSSGGSFGSVGTRGLGKALGVYVCTGIGESLGSVQGEWKKLWKCTRGMGEAL